MKYQILFVDDDSQTLRGIRRMLHAKRDVWEIQYAEGGPEALELMETTRFDVVVADMHMPVMSGGELLEEVQKRQPAAIRIILSGFSNRSWVMQTVKPAHQFLTKPFSAVALRENIERMLQLRNVLTNEEARRVVSQIVSLPTPSQIYHDIVAELEKEEPSLKRVGELVEQDIAAAAAVLKLVNSSFFGFFNKISSPAQAVTLLGAEVLKGVLLGVQLLSMLKENAADEGRLEALWQHCFRVGCCAKALARFENSDDDVVNACFVAGLLHDVGKLVLEANFPKEYKEVRELVSAEDIHVSEAEMRVFGSNHANVGAYLLGVWGVRPEVVDAVNRHHETVDRPDEFGPELVAHVADWLEHDLGGKTGPDLPPLRSGPYLGERLETWKTVCLNLLEEPAN